GLSFGSPAHVRRSHRLPMLDLLIGIGNVIAHKKSIGPTGVGKTKFKPAAPCSVPVKKTFCPEIPDNYPVRLNVLRKFAPLLVIVVGRRSNPVSFGIIRFLWLQVLAAYVILHRVE